MQNDGSPNGIFVRYTYNYREIDGIEEFHQMLGQEYLCQGNAKWIPNCSEGGEFWLTVFLASPIGIFIGELIKDLSKAAIVVAGKSFLLAPLKKSLSTLWKRNQDKWKLKVQKASFIFDDCEVVIGALRKEELNQIEVILKKIYEVKKSLEKEGEFPVIRIELPAELVPSSGKYELDQWRFDQEGLLNSMWIIVFADNSKVLYNGKEESMV